MALGPAFWAVLRLDGQRGALLPWAPVCLGLGIGIYFALPVEPDLAAWRVWAAAFAVALSAAAWLRMRAPLVLALVLVLAGIGVAGLRTAQVEAPVLGFRYYGPIEGRIVEIDRSGSDKPRLTLDRVVLRRMAPDETPARVRVSLHGRQDWLDPQPGQRVMLTGHLSPPGGPVEPGGFDFRRMAYFERLGAVGYTRSPALLRAPAEGAVPMARLRAAISEGVREVLPGRRGAVAVAILTGDRSNIDPETMEHLRVSNLAHLLAISGMHMGLLTGIVFAATRIVLAALPWTALRWPTKKIAALTALAAGAFYLALSGGNVTTQRAFIMAAVFLIAICLDRRALTLRGVAIAAMIVLLLRPEAMSGPGFQMSFAATVALVAAFRALRDRGARRSPKLLRSFNALIISSIVAEAATAPYGAAHFNYLSHYGLLANTLSIPIMGALVMPAAVAAAVLWPLGLSWLGLEAMALGLGWILMVAEFTASLGGAVTPLPSPAPYVLPAVSLGGLWLCLWRGRARLAGMAPIALALLVWNPAGRPEALITKSGGLIGVMGPEGRMLSKPRGDGFAAQIWLENDGDGADQVRAHARSPDDPERAVRFALGAVELLHVSGRGGSELAETLCGPGRIVVHAQPRTVETDRPPWRDARGCLHLDGPTLSRLGSVALRREGEGVRLITARGVAGRRPWTERAPGGWEMPRAGLTLDLVAQPSRRAAVQ